MLVITHLSCCYLFLFDRDVHHSARYPLSTNPLGLYLVPYFASSLIYASGAMTTNAVLLPGSDTSLDVHVQDENTAEHLQVWWAKEGDTNSTYLVVPVKDK